TPDNPSIILKGDGISETRNRLGNYVFVAAHVPELAGNSVPVLINGNPSGLVITLENPPLASFASSIVNGELILTNNSRNASEYHWVVDGEEITRANRLQVGRKVSSFNSAAILVSLTA